MQPTQPGKNYVSKYLELKAQIEELQAQLERTRLDELDEQVTDIKKKIVAYGIRPDMIFSKEDLAGKPVRGPGKKAPKYGDGNGNVWTGQGFKPQWVISALASGKTMTDLIQPR
jgi:DNA-binding protein H-NS